MTGICGTVLLGNTNSWGNSNTWSWWLGLIDLAGLDRIVTVPLTAGMTINLVGADCEVWRRVSEKDV